MCGTFSLIIDVFGSSWFHGGEPVWCNTVSVFFGEGRPFLLHRDSICLSCKNLSAPSLATIRPHVSLSRSLGWAAGRGKGRDDRGLMNDFSACRTSTGEEEQEECAGIDGEGPDGNVEGKRKTTA